MPCTGGVGTCYVRLDGSYSHGRQGLHRCPRPMVPCVKLRLQNKLKPCTMAHGRVLTVSEILGRVRLSFLLMKAAAVDMVLHQLLISKLLLQVECEGGAVVLPMHLQVHTLEADQFHEYRNQLSGLTTENIDEVCNHINMLGARLCLAWECGPAHVAHAHGQCRHLRAVHTASALVSELSLTWYYEFRSTSRQNTTNGFGSKLN